MFTPNLLRLLHLCDPALPVGSFSHSAGLETYVQCGKVKDKQTALQFIEQQLSQNLRYNDAAFASLAWSAAEENNREEIFQLDSLCTATKLPMEMRLASQKLGTRLIKIFAASATEMALFYWQKIQAGEALGHYCIAFAVIAHSLQLSLAQTVTGFYYNAASAFVTNSVKLIPLGQQHGQEILMSLFALIDQLVEKTLFPDKELLGLCCCGFDIAGMQHEQLYSRLYTS